MNKFKSIKPTQTLFNHPLKCIGAVAFMGLKTQAWKYIEMDGNVSPLQLQCSVLQEFPTQVSPIPFPPKRWVGSNLEPGFLGRRLSGLQLFLGSLLEVKEVLGHPGLVAFLCLDTPSCSDDVTMESSRVGANLLTHLILK